MIHPPQSPPLPPLPPQWSEHKYHASGKLYYYNSSTGDSTWDRPTVSAEEPSPSPVRQQQQQPPLPPLPPMWSEHKYHASGKLYYYNSSTGDSTWDRPTVSAEEPSPSHVRQQPPPEAAPAAVVPATLSSPPTNNNSNSDNSNRKQYNSNSKSFDENVVGLKDGMGMGQSFLRKRREVDTSSLRHPAAGITSQPEEKEKRARSLMLTNPFQLVALRIYAACKICVVYLITLECIASCAATIGMTCYWYYNSRNSNAWHGAMSFILVTFAVASPIVVALRMAFTRREQAIYRIGEIRAYMQHIYTAHCLWDWGKGGRAAATDYDFADHCDGVLEQLIGIGDELSRFLTLPTTSRGWNRTTHTGKQEASRTIEAAYQLLESITIHRMIQLTVYAERIKDIGLSGSEISRVRQYERHLSNHVEQLRLLKLYRTPQALWAFGRLFTIVLPAFYAPTYAEVAREVKSLGLGITFGVMTALVFATLFEAVQEIEDPFTTYLSLDGIDVAEELEYLNWNQLIKTRALFFPTAPEYPYGTKPVMTGTMYNPNVHYHSTLEERTALLQLEAEGHPLCNNNTNNNTVDQQQGEAKENLRPTLSKRKSGWITI